MQIRLREQCIPFRSRFHVEDDDPSRLSNEVIMEDSQRQARVADEGIQDAVRLRRRQVCRREGIQEEATRFAYSFGMFVHKILTVYQHRIVRKRIAWAGDRILGVRSRYECIASTGLLP